MNKTLVGGIVLGLAVIGGIVFFTRKKACQPIVKTQPVPQQPEVEKVPNVTTVIVPPVDIESFVVDSDKTTNSATFVTNIVDLTKMIDASERGEIIAPNGMRLHRVNVNHPRDVDHNKGDSSITNVE